MFCAAMLLFGNCVCCLCICLLGGSKLVGAEHKSAGGRQKNVTLKHQSAAVLLFGNKKKLSCQGAPELQVLFLQAGPNDQRINIRSFWRSVAQKTAHRISQDPCSWKKWRDPVCSAKAEWVAEVYSKTWHVVTRVVSMLRGSIGFQ